MMVRKEYVLEGKRAIKHESKIRKFLLTHSDTLRLTENQGLKIRLPFLIVELNFLKRGSRDRKFVRTLQRLRPFFINRVTNKKKYNDITQFRARL